MLSQILIPYKLKEIARTNRVQSRKESVAEHVYSCLILLEHLAPHLHSSDINLNHVRDLILYHDFEEILVDDVYFASEQRAAQQLREDAAHVELLSQLNASIVKKYESCYDEYNAQLTVESKLAKAIDKIDPMIQALTTPGLVKELKLTEEFYRNKNGPYMKQFPSLQKLFDDVLRQMKLNGEFDV